MKKHLLLTSLVTGLVVLAAVTKGTGPDTVFGSPAEDIPAEIVEADAPADDGIAPEAGSREEEVNGVLSGDENWSYVVNDNDEAVIIAYTGSDSYVTVPEEIDSRPVTSIRPTAFKGNLLIQKITMSGNIDTLWADSFAGCTNLVSADLKGVKELGDGAFKNCGNLESMTLYEGLITIPESCFENCNKELRIYLPKSLSVIKANAFKNTMSDSWAHIYYAGTEEEWKKITISDEGNTNLQMRALNSITYSSIPGEYSSGDFYTDSTGEWQYKKSSDKYYIYSYVGPRKDELTVPLTLDDHEVRTLNHNYSGAFIESGHAVKKVIVPEGFTSCDFHECSVDEVVLPESVETYDFYMSSIQEVTFPKNIDHIGGFSRCSRLVKMDIPDGVKSIYDNAFEKSALKQLSIPGSVTDMGRDICKSCDELETVTLKEGLTSVSSGAFTDLPALKKVSVPSTLKKVGDSAFSGCVSLGSFPLPEGFESVGQYAFYRCNSLQEITIPSTVKSLGKGAFENCASLKNVYVKKGAESIDALAFGEGYLNVWYEGTKAEWDSVCSGALPENIKLYTGWTAGNENIDAEFAFMTTDGFAMVSGYYGKGGDITIPSTARIEGKDYPVYEIREGAFKNCKSITSVTLPSDFVAFQEEAFYGCSNLKKINFPDSIELIDEAAFAGCASLTSITVPQKTTELKSRAFAGCSGLETVSLHDSVSTVGDSAFEGCTSLKNINLENVSTIGKKAFYECKALTAVSLSGADSIDDEAFAYTGLVSVTLPKLDTLEYRAFGYCDNLESVTFNGRPYGLLGNEVFMNDDALVNVTLSSDYEVIGDGMFKNCTSLSTISLPDHVDTIGDEAFYGCSALKGLEVNGTVTYLGIKVFSQCSSLESVPWLSQSDIGAVPKEAFSYCRKLISVSLPVSVKTIGSKAFYYCESLSDVDLGSVEEMADSFEYCYALKEIDLPETLTTIGKYAFQRTGLTHVTLPSGLDAINEGTFYGCSSLRTVSFSKKVEKIDYRAFDYCSRFRYVYYDGTSTERNNMDIKDTTIKSVTWKYKESDDALYEGNWVYIINGSSQAEIIDYLGSGETIIPVTLGGKPVKKVEEGLFVGNGDITSVVIEAALDSFPAFTDCNNLVSVKANTKATDGQGFPYDAFKGCTSLKIADLGKNGIGANGFEGCIKLQEFIIDDSEEGLQIGSNLFKDCVSLENAVLPTDMYTIPTGLFDGCAALESVCIPSNVGEIFAYSFRGCWALKSIVICGSPYIIYDDSFIGCEHLETVYYSGTRADWDGLDKGNNEALINANIICQYSGPASFSFAQNKYSCEEGKSIVSNLEGIYPSGADVSGTEYTADSDIIEVKADRNDRSKFTITAKAPGMARFVATCGAARSVAYVYVKCAAPKPGFDGTYLTNLIPGGTYFLNDELYSRTADEYGRIKVVFRYESDEYTYSYIDYGCDNYLVKEFKENINCNSDPGVITIRKKPVEPNIPELEESTETSLKMKKYEGYEYTIDDGFTFNEDGLFTSLTPGTTYRVGCRTKKTEVYEASTWRYKSFATEGIKPPAPDPSDDPSSPDLSAIEPVVSPYWDVKATEGNTVTFVPKSGYKDEKGDPLAFDVKTVISVDYTGRKHVSTTDKVKKNTSNDVEIALVSSIAEFADVSAKFKNNKTVPLSGGKQPQFVIVLKAKKSATPEQKKLVKAIAKDLKKKPVYFIIKPADITGATVSEIKTDAKKTKISKAVLTINGNSFKMKAGKDFDYKFEDGKAILTGKGNFTGSLFN